MTQHAIGMVYLVGAGPGDPELLTLKAVRVIGEADVILHDDLVNREMLRHARPGVRVIAVGKRGGCKSTPQEFIERLMVSEARAGNCVVRLKGGDPHMFGRGGEEAETLHANGILVEVVQGITAGMAAPARLGIPVTHRRHTPGVVFVTGHTRDGAQPNWAALAASGLTLVIYMGMSHIETIVAALLDAGLSPTTGAAVIRNAGLPGERGVVSSLRTVVADVEREALASPAIIVIGAVVSHANGRHLTPECHALQDRLAPFYPPCAVGDLLVR